MISLLQLLIFIMDIEPLVDDAASQNDQNSQSLLRLSEYVEVTPDKLEKKQESSGNRKLFDQVFLKIH